VRTSPSWKGSATSPSARTRRASSVTCGPCWNRSAHGTRSPDRSRGAAFALGFLIGRSRLLLANRDVVPRRSFCLASPCGVEAGRRKCGEGGRQTLHAFAVVVRCCLPELQLLPRQVLWGLPLANTRRNVQPRARPACHETHDLQVPAADTLQRRLISLGKNIEPVAVGLAQTDKGTRLGVATLTPAHA